MCVTDIQIPVEVDTRFAPTRRSRQMANNPYSAHVHISYPYRLGDIVQVCALFCRTYTCVNFCEIFAEQYQDPHHSIVFPSVEDWDDEDILRVKQLTLITLNTKGTTEERWPVVDMRRWIGSVIGCWERRCPPLGTV
jgi:hypothetical protein